jgi:hypothetical protein
MATLQELLAKDLGVSVTTKTASYDAASDEDAQIEKIAAELGLFNDSVKVASDSDEDEDESGEEKKPVEEQEKKGHDMSGLYESFFPEDELGVEKVAMDKVAAYEEALGARSHDYFTARFSARLEKFAADSISESSHPVSQFRNNKAGGSASIDTTSHFTDEISAENGQAVVGREEQVKQAAYRKAWLMSQLEG